MPGEKLLSTLTAFGRNQGVFLLLEVSADRLSVQPRTGWPRKAKEYHQPVQRPTRVTRRAGSDGFDVVVADFNRRYDGIGSKTGLGIYHGPCRSRAATYA
jgi:hypothetical protein